MLPSCGSGKDLRFLVLEIFGVLVSFIEKITMFRRALSTRNKVVGPHADFQGSFVAVESRSPRIIRFGILTPVALIPNDLRVTVIE